MKTWKWCWFIGVVILAGCGWNIPNPFPTPPAPTPTPTPVPEPTPVPPPGPVCEPNTNCDCWVKPPGQDWDKLGCAAPQICKDRVCEDPPPPPEVPTYEMNCYWLYPNIADCTPKQCGFETCKKAGFTDGRRCCAAAPEADPTRYAKEVEMMGGPRPDYILEVDEGQLLWHYVDEGEPGMADDWKAQVYSPPGASGKGRLWGCFPNRKACSDKDEVRIP